MFRYLVEFDLTEATPEFTREFNHRWTQFKSCDRVKVTALQPTQAIGDLADFTKGVHAEMAILKVQRTQREDELRDAIVTACLRLNAIAKATESKRLKKFVKRISEKL